MTYMDPFQGASRYDLIGDVVLAGVHVLFHG